MLVNFWNFGSFKKCSLLLLLTMLRQYLISLILILIFTCPCLWDKGPSLVKEFFYLVYRSVHALRLACQLIADKLVRKNHPTQVIGFVVDLAGKCVEGMQMNWANYLVNELEKDFREAWDLGYEFHYSWLIILIAFVTWKMPEGATIPEIEPSELLATRFSTLWYTNDMTK